MKYLSVTIQMKATKQYFPVALFIMLYMVVLTFQSVDEVFFSCSTLIKLWCFLFSAFCKRVMPYVLLSYVH